MSERTPGQIVEQRWYEIESARHSDSNRRLADVDPELVLNTMQDISTLHGGRRMILMGSGRTLREIIRIMPDWQQVQPMVFRTDFGDVILELENYMPDGELIVKAVEEVSVG